MRLFDGGGCSLPVMADDASEFRERVGHRRMGTEGFLAHIRQARLLQGHVAGGAAIDHVLFGNPYLMDATLEPPREASRIRTVVDQLHIKTLVVTPLADEIFGGGNGRDQRQQDAHRGEAARRSADKEACDAGELIFSTHSAPPGPNPCLAFCSVGFTFGYSRYPASRE